MYSHIPAVNVFRVTQAYRFYIVGPVEGLLAR